MAETSHRNTSLNWGTLEPMETVVRRDREPWSAELAVLADLDLRLGSGRGTVVVLNTGEPDRSDLLVAFQRLAVHSIGRSSLATGRHLSPWRRAFGVLAAAVPHRREITRLVEMLDVPPASGPSLSEVADAIVAATQVHPFVIVLDEVAADDHRTWELAAVLARSSRAHGLLVVIGHGGTTPDLAELGGRWVEVGGRDDPRVTARQVELDDAAHSEELLALAIWGRPATIALLARFLDKPWVAVADAVDDLVRTGAVERSAWIPGAVTVADGVDTRPIVVAAPIERRRELHLVIARTLMDSSNSARLMTDTAEAARHALAAGSDMDLIVSTALTAASEYAAAGRLRRAAAILNAANDAAPPARDRARILSALGVLTGRLGMTNESTILFDSALRTARELDDIELVATVTAAASFVAPQIHGSGVEERTLRRLLEQLGDRRPGARAMLELRLADLRRLTDPGASHTLVDAALENARSSNDPDVEALALRLATLLSTDHPSAKDLDHIVDSLDALPGSLAQTASFAPRVSLCLLRGDRRELDDLAMRYRVALREYPMALWEADVETLRAVQALHDIDRAGFLDAIEAMRECGRRTGALGGYWIYPLALMWTFVTGEELDVSDPDLPVPTIGGVFELFMFSAALVSNELGRPQALPVLASSMPAPEDVPVGEWTTPTWWPFIARAALHTGDRAIATQAIANVRSSVDAWVLVGRFVPIGPVGWFVAETQAWLGDRAGAVASADAGLGAARRMRSHAWIALCSLQRARLAHASGDLDTARALLDQAERLVALHGLEPARASCDALRADLDSPLRGPEAEVLRLVAEGLSNKQIAHHLDIGVKRVERLLSAAFRRLGVNNRAEAVAVLLKTDAIR